jgi:hypothetical protein
MSKRGTPVVTSSSETLSRCARAVRERAGAAPRVRKLSTSHGWSLLALEVQYVINWNKLISIEAWADFVKEISAVDRAMS